MTSLLLHESEVKLRMNVNNKDTIRMYLGYIWLILLPKRLYQSMLSLRPVSNGFGLCSPIKASFVTNNLFFDVLGDIYLSS